MVFFIPISITRWISQWTKRNNGQYPIGNSFYISVVEKVENGKNVRRKVMRLNADRRGFAPNVQACDVYVSGQCCIPETLLNSLILKNDDNRERGYKYSRVTVFHVNHDEDNAEQNGEWADDEKCDAKERVLATSPACRRNDELFFTAERLHWVVWKPVHCIHCFVPFY